jgi:3-hydroxyisobutyrate dehydrogenase-like beta-hydroxyacid dehydrogenase
MVYGALCSMTVGFVGLGRMGSGMARNLVRAGHSLLLFNRTRSRAEDLSRDGGSVVDSPAAASESDAVLTMLSDDPAVDEVVFGDSGILQALKPGGLHVSHSTISTAMAQRLAAAHAGRKQAFVSAPVFGRPEAAANAQLIVTAAGDPEAVERARPLFDAVGRKTVVAGSEPWQANAVKLSGNFMIAAMIEAFGEAFAATRKSGVDPAVFLDIMMGLFRSPVYEAYGTAIAQRKFEPAGFALKLGLKDVRLVLALADEIACPMPVASAIHDQFLAAVASGFGDQDWSGVTKIAARNSGLGD